MTSVRAKFHCNSIQDLGSCVSVKLSAVTSTDGDNKDFTQYTPSGDFQISIDKEAAAAEFFYPGKNYYLDISQAEKLLNQDPKPAPDSGS